MKSEREAFYRKREHFKEAKKAALWESAGPGTLFVSPVPDSCNGHLSAGVTIFLLALENWGVRL